MTYWLPVDEEDIVLAIANGVLSETQHLDVKLTYAARDQHVNTKLAQDMAAFAIDGGAILVGVRQSGTSFAAEPQPLPEIESLAERVSQVARDRPSPPVFAPLRTIPSEKDPGKGYLLIEVPPSPTAPHSVDGVYWARSERANRRITDDRELDRLVRARVDVQRLAADLLEAELPGPMGRPDVATLYVVAEPVQAHDDEALLRLGPEEPGKHPYRGVDGGVWEIMALSARLPIRSEDSRGRQFSEKESFPGTDGLRKLAEIHRRALGRAVGANSGARHRNEIELREHGGIRLVREKVVTSRTLPAQFTNDVDLLLSTINDPGIVSSVWLVISTAVELGRRIQYRGSWSFALFVEGIEGTISTTASKNIDDQLDLSNRSRYDQYAYDRSTSATTIELESDPVQVLYRLVGRLVRGLDVDESYARWIEGWPKS
ncbi:MAG: ATP-binding protein [Microbacteriaceae bacterium]|nr:ATP-binding protein [Microbacteriaceae bacterium]